MALGGRLTLSDDSHGPQAVGLHYEDLYRYLGEQNIHTLWRLSATESLPLTESNDIVSTPFALDINVDKHSISKKSAARARIHAVKLPSSFNPVGKTYLRK